ncbi:hypothetical protein MA16_Dca026664 [Dendrobium catenatum]|uniref:Uncharacterized protein n=1 Tax=Dendrobium catenatum TaxID=906689 RepID=A0A2I0WWB1_9ASPA|nr:hypothetical protein MA16_Dca026664 [Dendrobium catenatum]
MYLRSYQIIIMEFSVDNDRLALCVDVIMKEVSGFEIINKCCVVPKMILVE